MITIIVKDIEIYDNAAEQFDTILGDPTTLNTLLSLFQNGNQNGRFRTLQQSLHPSNC